MEEIKNKILQELKDLNFVSGSLWVFQLRIRFINNKLNPIERRKINDVIKNMIDDGYFITLENRDESPLKLTDKCEKEIWGE